MGPPLKQLLKDPEYGSRVKVVFKHFPLGFHKQAKPAAVAAMAAHQQGKFWEYHDKIFANQKGINDENLKKWAEEIGLDVPKWEAYVKSGEGDKVVDADMKEGRTAGLRGTPTIYINGRKFQAMGGYSPAAFTSVFKKYFSK